MIKPAMKLRVVVWLALGLIALVVWQIRLQLNPIKTTDWNYLFNAGVAFFYFAAAGLAFARRRLLSEHDEGRAVLRNFGLAALFWGLAYIVWAYYNLILTQSIPYPSLADAFFLLAYPLLGVGVWQLREWQQIQNTRGFNRRLALFVVLATIAIFAFLNRPDVSPDLGLTKNLLNVAYSLGDVLLVSMAFVGFSGGKIKKHLGLFTFAMFLAFQAIADFMFAYTNNNGSYWNGNFTDLLFGISGFLLALALAQDNLLTVYKSKK
jgi:hypothetical protein